MCERGVCADLCVNSLHLVQIKTYPRSIATSVRCSDERRREARALRRDRKERERLQKQQQLQHMKNLKREEILGRLQRLQQLTGSQEDGFSLSHLQGDFNPEQHDMMMQVGDTCVTHTSETHTHTYIEDPLENEMLHLKGLSSKQ